MRTLTLLVEAAREDGVQFLRIRKLRKINPRGILLRFVETQGQHDLSR